MSPVNANLAMVIDSSRGPAHLDRLHPLARSQPEMESRVAGRLKAPASEPRRDLGATAGPDGDHGTDSIPVRPGPFELKYYEMAADSLGLVPEFDQRFVLRDHQGIEPSVVVEVADGEAAANVEPLERRAGLSRDVDQGPGRAVRGRVAAFIA